MSKHSFTILFIIISTIFNIILTFGLIILLIVGVSFLLFKLGGLNPQSSIGLIAVVVCFLGGLIGGMVIFTKLCGLVIDKFNLSSKLESHVLGRYLPRGTKAPKVQPEEPKTVMPDSVKLDPDEE
ncbi:MAG: hypothetical protein IKI90_00640 [Treponema sp.]|nr:hypothetical protein [Treponema sp.]MBR4004336.1 hypothetical protein [Treponema sp.]